MKLEEIVDIRKPQYEVSLLTNSEEEEGRVFVLADLARIRWEREHHKHLRLDNYTRCVCIELEGNPTGHIFTYSEIHYGV